MSTSRIHVSQLKLRRLAARAQQMLVRHAAVTPELKVLEAPVNAAVARFADLHTRVKNKQLASSVLLRDAKAKIAELSTRMLKWASVLRETVHETKFATSDNVPDDLLLEAKRMMEVLEAGQQDGTVTFAPEALAALLPAYEAANSAWIASQDALEARQRLMRELQEAARALHQKLIGMRRTMRAAFGPEHRDYQKMKVANANSSDDDEDDDIDVDVGDDASAPTVVEPVTNGVKPPVAA